MDRKSNGLKDLDEEGQNRPKRDFKKTGKDNSQRSYSSKNMKKMKIDIWKGDYNFVKNVHWIALCGGQSSEN